VFAILPALAGCVSPPVDHSTRYVLLPPGIALDSTNRPVIVPEACLIQEPAFLESAGPMLPPGCANAYNLAEMVERKSDLLRGRQLAPAPAAPTARAARRYIDGDQPAASPPKSGDISTTEPKNSL
jgi:hypothetical protein